MAESILLTAARVSTFDGDKLLTGATDSSYATNDFSSSPAGTSSFNAPAEHSKPTRNRAAHRCRRPDPSERLSVWLYVDGKSIWRQGSDTGSSRRQGRPSSWTVRPFRLRWRCTLSRPAHLQSMLDEVEVGSALLVVGYPLGFHDVIYHLPVVRCCRTVNDFNL